MRGRRAAAELLELPSLAEIVGVIDGALLDEQKASALAADTPAPTPIADGDVTVPDDYLIASVLPALSQDDGDRVLHYRRLLDETMRSQVRLVVEASSGTAIADEIRNSVAGQCLGVDDGGRVTVFAYDVKLSGEAVTNPQTRKPPLRNHYKKMMLAAFASRGPTSSTALTASDVFIMFDGGKHGNHNELQTVFKQALPDDDGSRRGGFQKQLERKTSTIFVYYEEKSLRERKDKVRGVGTLDQLEHVHVVSRDGIAGTPKDRPAPARCPLCP